MYQTGRVWLHLFSQKGSLDEWMSLLWGSHGHLSINIGVFIKHQHWDFYWGYYGIRILGPGKMGKFDSELSPT